jgi:hypothetical protein
MTTDATATSMHHTEVKSKARGRTLNTVRTQRSDRGVAFALQCSFLRCLVQQSDSLLYPPIPSYPLSSTMATLAAPPSSMPTTLGMQIDALLDEIDSLSSTQLYAIIVAVTVVISFVLLGTHHAPDEVLTVTSSSSNSSSSASSPSKGKTTQSSSSTSSSSGPEPRWHIFRWINWLAIIAFAVSVVEFGWNADRYLHSADGTVLLKFLVGWSVFLAYFFGFFGVSFVHDIHAADADNEGVMNAAANTTTTIAEATSEGSATPANARYVILCYDRATLFVQAL